MTPKVSDVLAALADPTRLRIVQLLSQGPCRPGQLAAAAGTSAPVMSRHLRVLLQAGIVRDERPREDARARVFWLRPEPIVAVQAWLDQLQGQADKQLASFKRHVERTGAA